MDTLPSTTDCPAFMGMLRNAWYVVAFSHEVGTAAPLQRMLCGEALALFRTSDGVAVALEDRCPHRGVPLSQGKVRGDALACAYHGFEFGRAGACTKVPSQAEIPARMRVKSYPVAERGCFVWVWAGDAARADEALLPDHYALGFDREGWTSAPYGMLEIGSNYAMLFENLLDTSHISFLHGTAIDSGRMAQSAFRSEVEGSTVRFIRSLKDDMPNPSNAKQYGLEMGVRFDRELTSEARLPNLHIIHNSFTFPDKPGHAPHIRINVMPITPASERSHYQFLAMTASYPETHPESLRNAMMGVLWEDEVVLREIQKIYDAQGPDLPEVSVRADEGALRARRVLAGLVRAEQGG